MLPRQLSRRAVLAGLALPLVFLAAPAAADKLDDLRTSGAVGERFDGFLVVRDAKARDAKSVVDEINGKRRQIYEKRAKQDGATVEQVGAIYAKEIMERAPKGTWFLKDDGSWARK